MAEESKKSLPAGITHRKDGRYMWRFKYDGQQYSGYCKKLADAKKQMRDKRYEVEHGIYSKEQNILFDAWFNEWLKTYKTANCKESTLFFYQNVYKRYIKPVFGGKQVTAIKADQIQRFINEKAKEFSKTTASTINFLMFNCLQQAARNGIICRNPMENATPPKFRKAEKKKALTAEQQRAFLDAAKDSCYYSLYRIATLTGMRIGEVLGLTWEDVNFAGQEIHVSHTLSYTTEKGQYLDTPKSDSSRRIIPMRKGGALYELLKDRRTEQKRQKIRAGQYWTPQQGMESLVFTTELGTPHYSTNIRKNQRQIIKHMQESGVDIELCTFHTLRHCFATRCIENGMDPKALQAILGHSTFAMTMDLYCDVMEDTKRRELDRISAAL